MSRSVGLFGSIALHAAAGIAALVLSPVPAFDAVEGDASEVVLAVDKPTQSTQPPVTVSKTITYEVANEPLDATKQPAEVPLEAVRVPVADPETLSEPRLKPTFKTVPVPPKAAGNKGEAKPAVCPATGAAELKACVTAGCQFHPAPKLPSWLMRKSWSGEVKVAYDILASGATANVRVVSSCGYDSVDEACVDAVKRWSFKPATRDGAAVAVHEERVFEFRTR